MGVWCGGRLPCDAPMLRLAPRDVLAGVACSKREGAHSLLLQGCLLVRVVQLQPAASCKQTETPFSVPHQIRSFPPSRHFRSIPMRRRRKRPHAPGPVIGRAGAPHHPVCVSMSMRSPFAFAVISALAYGSCRPNASEVTRPGARPPRVARPTRRTYSTPSRGKSKRTTWPTAGKSIPREARSVQTST